MKPDASAPSDPGTGNRGNHRRRGIALVTIISVIAILTVLTVAIISISDSERKSSVKYADGEFARNLSDAAVNVVMGQIWEGTRRESSSQRSIWASQPGAIRKYNANGSFLHGYKLYSDDTMVVSGAERQMIDDTPDVTWRGKPAMWVDLNEPVIRPDSTTDADNLPEVTFPIVDPRAFVRSDFSAGNNNPNSPNVEGFQYQRQIGSTNIDWVVDATSHTDVNARLPMPVQWLYMLKDGSLGHMVESGSGTAKTYNFTGSSGVAATADNPIVGRLAFWADDETSKLNINTASEPTFWASPIAYHDRELEWAVSQPTRFEYQRYPGHPATVALSTVLLPNTDLDPYGKSAAIKAQMLAKKERLYEIMPKINSGGSKAGAVPFWAMVDPKFTGTREFRVDVSSSLKERLYATVDELLFSQRVQGGERLTQDNTPGASVALFGDHGNQERALERVRFFLTAQARSPEITMFGTPRVAMWPVANERSIGPMRGDAKEYRTVFDNLIAYCATLGAQPTASNPGNTYFFRRADSTSATRDVEEIARNRQLMEYVYALFGRDFPSGGQAARSFQDKYGADAPQIVTEIFDYIRSTNLNDGVLSPTRAQLLADPYRVNSLNTKQRLQRRDALLSTTRTYTSPRASTNRGVTFTTSGGATGTDNEQITTAAYPGHGTVVPMQVTLGGQATRGFGRFPVISEVGFHFICTGDGKNDNGSWRIRAADGSPSSNPADISGGRTAVKLSNDALGDTGANVIIDSNNAEMNPVTKVKDIPGRWFSNYPPYPKANSYGTSAAASPGDRLAEDMHPGYKPENWNATLDSGIPLAQDERRVQAMLALEMTVPASGYSGLYPDFCIEVDGLDTLRVTGAGGGRGTLIFNTLSGRRSWRAGGSLFDTTHNRVAGGSVGPWGFTQSRQVKGSSDMPDDPSYDSALTTGGNTQDGDLNYDLCSTFFTVKGNTFSFQGGRLKINIYATRDMSPKNLVQSYTINFDPATLPTPELVVLSSPKEQWQDTLGRISTQERVEAPRWWTFNWGGALNRWKKQPDGTITRFTPGTGSADDWRTLGRFFTTGSSWGSRRGIARFDSLVWGRNGATNVYPTGGTYGDYTKPMPAGPPATTGSAGNSGYLPPDTEAPYGQDVLISMVPKHGDMRLLAAKKDVPESDWEKHPSYGGSNAFLAHSFMRFVSDYESGIDLGANLNLRLVRGARYRSSSRPDLPQTSAVLANMHQRYGDYDNGAASLRDGPWINKPDEGNSGLDNYASSASATGMYRMPTAYFDEMWRSAEAGESFMSPNRMISSPGMFGSLSVGVKSGDPWRTLLFRPYVPGPGGSVSHPGSPNYGVTSTAADTSKSPFAGENPADHYIMDLFWMPVVEPYAISEPFSSAGKINLNYQMVPFTYIRRATGLHAVLKSELLSAYATANADNYHRNPDNTKIVQFDNGYGDYYQFAKWSDQDSRSTTTFYSNGTPAKRFWHRNIDLETRASRGGNSTLHQFDARFEFNAAMPAGTHGLFRAASQICEIHLVPKKVSGANPAKVIDASSSTADLTSDGSDASPGTLYSYASMGDFWNPRAITGDNVKERPYANIYGKVTTQSNTFRVHYRAQAIRKARSVAANTFDPSKDTVSSDYRGSALIERRIDPADTRIPDYAANPSARPLDDFYNFRVLENKRFAP